MSSGPDLRTMELLVAVSSEGSIGAAARALRISQQAASQRLRGFELSLGTALMTRGSHGSTLTPEGRAVTEWASRLVEVAREVETAIDAVRGQRRSSLQVAASMTVAEHLLPPWLVELRRGESSRPATSVRLRALNSVEVVQALHDGTADLGFVEGSQAPPHLPSTPVRLDRLVLVAAPTDPLASRSSITARTLATTPLTLREPGSGTREVLEVALGAAGLGLPEEAVTLTTTTSIRASVRAGGAPAVLSELAVRADVAAGALVQVDVRGLDLTRTLRAVWSGGAEPASSAARALVRIARRSAEHDGRLPRGGG